MKNETICHDRLVPFLRGGDELKGHRYLPALYAAYALFTNPQVDKALYADADLKKTDSYWVTLCEARDQGAITEDGYIWNSGLFRRLNVLKRLDVRTR